MISSRNYSLGGGPADVLIVMITALVSGLIDLERTRAYQNPILPMLGLAVPNSAEYLEQSVKPNISGYASRSRQYFSRSNSMMVPSGTSSFQMSTCSAKFSLKADTASAISSWES
jgi:hypothetical protein